MEEVEQHTAKAAALGLAAARQMLAQGRSVEVEVDRQHLPAAAAESGGEVERDAGNGVGAAGAAPAGDEGEDARGRAGVADPPQQVGGEQAVGQLG